MILVESLGFRCFPSSGMGRGMGRSRTGERETLRFYRYANEARDRGRIVVELRARV